MKTPPRNHTALWNDMSYEERSRLMPYMIENHMLHICQSKEKAIAAHKAHMRQIDSLLRNLKLELDKLNTKEG